MIENILLADSGTGQSEQMLKSLMELPAIQRAAVTVLHVIPPKITAEEMAEQRQAGAKLLAEAVARLHLDPVISVNTMLREGDPKDTVLHVADEINADLIIMGSRGLKRLQSILENSVSQYVFQLSSRPMLLVRDDLFVKKINRIMVALNNSAAAKASLDLAVRLIEGVKGANSFLPTSIPTSRVMLIPLARLLKEIRFSRKPQRWPNSGVSSTSVC